MKETANIAGTSLIALKRLPDNTQADKAAVAEEAYKLMQSSETADLVKVTALQIGSELHDSRFYPLAKTILDSNAEVQLKMSAIAAIGLLGNTSDYALLEKYQRSTDIRFRAAAKQAAKNIGGK